MVVPGRDLAIVVLANQRRFFPLIAEAIADTQWPAPALRPAVPDAAPALTADVQRILGEAGTGELNAADFAEAGSNARDFLSGFGGALLSAVGAVQSIDLLSDTQLETGRKRVYRVRFRVRDMIWVATTDQTGRFLELRPGSEAD